MLKTLFFTVSLAVFDHTRKTQVQAVLLGILLVLLMAPLLALFFMPQPVEATGIDCGYINRPVYSNTSKEGAELHATHVLQDHSYADVNNTQSGWHYVNYMGCVGNTCSIEHGFSFACTVVTETYPNAVIIPPVVIPPTNPPASVMLWLSGDASSVTIDYNQTATLYWSSKNAKSCTASGDWTGPKTVNSANDNTGGYDGDERMGPLTSTKTYTITCFNSAGVASAPASVTVNVKPQSDPSLTFSANTTSIISGGSVVLTWDPKNVSSCTAGNGWTGGKSITLNSQTISNIIADTSYELTCTGNNNVKVFRNIPITVTGPTLKLSANTTNIDYNGWVSLSWVSSGLKSNSCTLSNGGGWTGTEFAGTGDVAFTNLTANTTYTITCMGNNNATISSSVSVVVTAPPICTFTYSEWGSCQSNSTQSRTTTTAPSPQGCTGGTSVLTQPCVYTPSTSPTTCTAFTYSAWGSCQSNSTQSRATTASSPQGCTGGTPVLSQSCVYTQPAVTSLPDEVLKSEGEPTLGNCMFGNPCNPATGNKYQVEEDFASSNAGLSLTRYYNSIDRGNGKDFGSKWSFTYGGKLDIDWGPAGAPQCITQASSTMARAVTVREPDGGGIPFTCKPAVSDGVTTQCTGQADAPRVRLYQEACNFRLILPTGDREYYTLGGRKLYDVTNVGYITNYSYTAQGILDRVTNNFGHYLKFEHRPSDGRISAVSDSNGTNKTRYYYDTNNNLTKVTYPDNTSKVYIYDKPGFPNHLTGISYVDTAGVTKRFATYDYDTNGKATLTQHAPLIAASTVPQEKFSFAYDSSTQTTVTDGAGIKSVMKYATTLGVKNLIEILSPSDGKSVKQTYYPDNNLKCRKDEEGHVTTYRYNSTGQLSGITEGMKGDCVTSVTVPGVTRSTSYEYIADYTDLPVVTYSDSLAAPYTALGPTMPYSKAEVLFYDDPRFWLPTQITVRSEVPLAYPPIYKDARSTKIGYNDLGQINSIDGPRIDVTDITKFDYYQCNTGNECGQLKSTTNALGHITNYNTYDANGRLKKMTDPNGLVTEYVYDLRGRVTTVTQRPPVIAARTTTFTYKPWGDIETASFADGTKLTYDYYDSHDVSKVTDRGGNYINYFYDAKGNVNKTENRDATGALSRYVDYTHDIRNRLDTINAAGSITDVNYDAVGNLVSITDPNKNPATTFTPDELNRNTLAIEHGLAPTNFKYDAAGNLATTSSPFDYPTGLNQKHENTYKYNDHGDLLESFSPDTGKTVYTYDEAGNIKTKLDARGVKVIYTYDALNRPTFIDYPDTNEDVTLQYDKEGDGDHACWAGKGRLCRVVDQSGVTIYAYNTFGDVFKDIHSQNGTVSYLYDNGSRVTSITYPSGIVVTYKRSATTGQITSVEHQSPGATAPTVLVSNRLYYSDGLLKSQTYGNGVTELRTYDRQGRMTKQTVGGVTRDYSLYDANGNLKTLTVTGLSTTAAAFAYTYNTFDQLESDAFKLMYTHTYDFNGSGNRTSTVRTTLAGLSPVTASYTYMPRTNRLASIGGTTVTLDPSGNMTADDVGDTFTYGNGGTLKTASNGESIVGTYTSNFLNQRTKKVAGTMTTNYRYDIEGNLIEEMDATGKTLRTYVWADGEPVAQLRYTMNEPVPPITTAPKITGFARGDTSSTTINVFGSGFLLGTGNTTVKVNGVTASTFQVIESTMLFLLLPPGVTSGSIQVSTKYGTSTSSTNLGPAPTGLTIGGLWASSSNNQMLYVFGSGFVAGMGNTRVSFSGVRATVLQVLSPTSLFAMPPAGTPPGSYQISVNTAAGTTTASSPFILAPYIPASSWSYIHPDHLGTPRSATDDTGKLVWTNEGYAFGESHPIEDPDLNQVKTSINLRLPGQYYDLETGLHYNWNRYYSPRLGRYITSDPIGYAGGLHTYNYADNNPVRWGDPFGLEVTGTWTGGKKPQVESVAYKASTITNPYGNIVTMGAFGVLRCEVDCVDDKTGKKISVTKDIPLREVDLSEEGEAMTLFEGHEIDKKELLKQITSEYGKVINEEVSRILEDRVTGNPSTYCPARIE